MFFTLISFVVADCYHRLFVYYCFRQPCVSNRIRVLCQLQSCPFKFQFWHVFSCTMILIFPNFLKTIDEQFTVIFQGGKGIAYLTPVLHVCPVLGVCILINKSHTCSFLFLKLFYLLTEHIWRKSGR
jgi:hypothetical protein